jgi:hypothetical protein
MSRAVNHAVRADARHQAEVVEHWRDWRTYLDTQLQLLDALQAEATSLPNFEREATSWEVQREQAEATLKRIPAPRRAIFARVCEERRQAVQRELEAAQQNPEARAVPLDAHAIERDVLAGLLAEAEGQDDEWDKVPMDDQTWYELAVPTLNAAPDAAAYSVGDDDATWRRSHLAGLGGLVLALILGLWLTWPRNSPAADSHGLPPAEINGEAVQPWPVVQVVLVADDGASMTLAVTDIQDGPWPNSQADAAPAA